MNPITNLAAHQQPVMPPLPLQDSNNRALHSMAACALNAVEGLDRLGAHVLCVTVQGAKPVIEIMHTAAKFTLFNSKNWQTHIGFCPVKQRAFSQFFIEYRECLVTWTKWR